MSDVDEIIKSYERLNDSGKINFLRNFHNELSKELALFFLSIFTDKNINSILRIEAIKVIGLYDGNYDKENIKKSIINTIKEEDDDEIQVFAINALSNIIDDNDSYSINAMYDIIMGDYYILCKEAAFALIVAHKKSEVSKLILSKLLNDREFGRSAKRELESAL
ncbi:hypothetical protein U2T78_004408 [Providencia stuartii]|uniref:HEAT repeat domain-containing protein n=1 Tax=Providencia stuartii TaxID=588 RepID=A0AAJ1N506_PROST|nr:MULTISPECIES: hypothetical protein [Providencia]EMA3643573.1 hypothetical protein [Providencia stuartii]KNZ86498.1 hypothetical protein AFL46_06035 [Providencia stuartii]MBW3103550.1 hypothetical protein [Providencia stuartii]MCB5220004.1 hypothetical protein [Providencia stuartii]MCX3072388.1 hypothetical protein [Providencia stuartii]